MTHVGIFGAMTKQRKPRSNIRCASSVLYFTWQGLYTHAQHYTNSAQLCFVKWTQIRLQRSIKQIHDYSLHIGIHLGTDSTQTVLNNNFSFDENVLSCWDLLFP